MLATGQGRHLLGQSDASEQLTHFGDLRVRLPVSHRARNRGPLQPHALGGVPEEPSSLAEADSADVPTVDADHPRRGMPDADQGVESCRAPLAVARLYDDPVARAGDSAGSSTAGWSPSRSPSTRSPALPKNAAPELD